ncbi:MAG: universal stress protein [Chloroflexota bacterium]|jgi:nucleotide-binding universal stress UspA family protein
MRFLIATGGSKHSDLAVQAGLNLARCTNSSVTILTVIKDPKQRPEAQRILERALAGAALPDAASVGPDRPVDGSAAARPGIHIETKIRLGHPAEEIVSEAGEGDYRLMVVGTWPKRQLLHGLLAPTTERVVMQAPCPVLVAKGDLSSMDHVLLCVSGANSPSRAAALLRDLAECADRRLSITVLHVMSQISVGPDPGDDWQLVASAEELIEGRAPEGRWLRQEVERLKRTPAQVRARVRHGLVVDEVLMEALEGKCDLIVAGAHRQAGWQRFLLDDLTHQLVVRADRPVLIV